MTPLPSFIGRVVQMTGLPPETWPIASPAKAPADGTYYTVGYAAEHDPLRRRNEDCLYGMDRPGDMKFSRWRERGSLASAMREQRDRMSGPIMIPPRTLSDLRHLPAAHVLGQAVLVRLDTGGTAMVSVAEAAWVLLGEARAELLWITAQLIQRHLRGEESRAWLRWRVEMTWSERIAPQWIDRASRFSLIRKTINDLHPWMQHRAETRPDVSPKAELIEGTDAWVQAQEQLDLHLDQLRQHNEEVLACVREFHQTKVPIPNEEVDEQLRQLGANLGAIQQQNEEIEKLIGEIDRKRTWVIYWPDRFISNGALRMLEENRRRIRQHNDEIIRLIQGLRQQPAETDAARPDALTEPRSSMAASPSKQYKPMQSTLSVEAWEGVVYIFVSQVDGMRTEVGTLVEWLEVALGGDESGASMPRLATRISLKEENRGGGERQKTESRGCWRGKILSGNILAQPTSTTEVNPRFPTAPPPPERPAVPHPFSGVEDGLMLSAAALWSLFDNALERVPDCQCTFKMAAPPWEDVETMGAAASSPMAQGFLQCRGSNENWLLWHYQPDERPCRGERCDDNVRIALTSAEAGERLYTTTPCVLGWTAESRTAPTQLLWVKDRLAVSNDFKKRVLERYVMKELQALAQLSVPAVVTPQIGGAVTFAKRKYQVAHSIDHKSDLAMEMAAAAVVLLFDESRGIHITCDGADMIEVLCLQYLHSMGIASDLPRFCHTTALNRLRTWHHSGFRSLTGQLVTGDHLIREASSRISRFVEYTRQKTERKSGLLYWLLEDVLLDREARAVRAPNRQHNSWRTLAFTAPPLIFAVAELDARYIQADGCPVQWQGSEDRPKPHFSLFRSPTEAGGGVLASWREMKRWLAQASLSCQANLSPTPDRMLFGTGEKDWESTYQVVERGQASVNRLFESCKTCEQLQSRRCLHSGLGPTSLRKIRNWQPDLVVDLIHSDEDVVPSPCETCVQLQSQRCLHYIQ